MVREDKGLNKPKYDKYLWVDFSEASTINFEDWRFKNVAEGIDLYKILRKGQFKNLK